MRRRCLFPLLRSLAHAAAERLEAEADDIDRAFPWAVTGDSIAAHARRLAYELRALAYELRIAVWRP